MDVHPIKIDILIGFDPSPLVILLNLRTFTTQSANLLTPDVFRPQGLLGLSTSPRTGGLLEVEPMLEIQSYGVPMGTTKRWRTCSLFESN